MVSKQALTLKQASAGETAVDGLFSGLGAGLVMVVYMVLVGLFMRESPGQLLARFSAGDTGSPWAGLLSHLAVSGIYGLVFGLFATLFLRRWPRRETGWLAGLVYGLALFLVGEFVILPGVQSPLLQIPMALFAVAHLIYGFMLGALVVRGMKA